MIYRPIRLLPDATSIDSTVINKFYCTIDGDTCDSYRLIIYNANTGVEVYNSTKINLSPIKYGGEIIEHSLPESTLTNGIDYTYVFKLYEGVTEVSSRITLFYCNLTPTVGLTFTTPISTQKINLQATYSQAQNIGITEFTYVIKSGTTIISEYTRTGTQDTRFTFSGLLNNSSGTIEFKGITQRGQSFTTGELPYTVSYQSPTISISPSTTLLYDSKVKFSWGEIEQFTGIATGNYNYVNDFIVNNNIGIHLLPDSTLEYEVEHGYEYTLKYKLCLNTGFNGIISKQYNTDTTEYVNFGYADGKFYWDNNGVTAISLSIPLNSDYAYVFLLPQKTYIKVGSILYEIKI